MSGNNNKPGAYGGGSASDTSFRKTWDRAEYAAKAAEHEAHRREEGKARHEAAAAGKKYVRRASTPPDARATEARRSRLDVGAMVGKTVLVPAGSAVGKRGRGAGFYCEACDLTFKDNLQFVEHLNSKQHLVATGQTGEVRRATVGEVRERLAWLKRRREEDKKEEVVDLGERLEVAREREEREREEKRRKRNEKRRKTKGGVGVKEEYDPSEGIIA
ncbi:c2h2 finger domain protein [Diplodia corticola]|uniref:C2h2 finger domain protein n=1 Tax=Diplodia corticola TaxID=236234 RepID=A0A1J9RV57_9PEZI|nr:c2h2 finger domain protein [Diplodia corticola]OJD31732.1 c2h2 finger domain protein [Diplodia corticola]